MPVNKDDLNVGDHVEYHPVGLVYWRDRQDRYRQTVNPSISLPHMYGASNIFVNYIRQFVTNIGSVARRRYRRHCPGLGRGTSLRYHERQHWQVGCLQAGKHREEDLK
ncbi:hypothetical protein BC938DRAFT_477875 [Jimgerdemannia flammicorona]|uniref:Uncharacterized protein n=1 Tax=Jimgerdemannia flammicorona TaxID=994334 RepID=A0A433QNQ0_9FUNG|nr:hypothetical protein BC938DRAFT_477875 [Jimgerdemannia flammicorona]